MIARSEREALCRCGGLVVLSCLTILVGCGPVTDRQILQLREQFLTDVQPANPSSLAAVIASLATDGEGSEREVTVVGRVYGGELSPFDQREASFSIIELPEPGHSHDDPNDCPFCKRKLAAAALAVVQICDAQGNLLDLPADKLLGLSKNQDVIVTGRASMVGELLIIQADSLYCLQREAAEKFAAEFAAQTAS